VTDEKKTDSKQPEDGTFDPDASERLFFAAQTIQNACGTQALLSVLLNQDDKVDIGGPLKEFKEFTGLLPSDVRTLTSISLGHKTVETGGANWKCSCEENASPTAT
jgi:Ubiquitin carboxyl-terminal hydrolase, family 1